MGAVTRRNPTFRSQPQASRRHRPDYWILVLSAALLAIGLIVVYAISPGLAVEKQVSEGYFINRQLVWTLLGIIAFALTASLPMTIWRRLERPLLIVAAIAAVAVRLFGERVNGAYRWIQVGGMSFQPVELIKFSLLIWLASFLTRRIKNGTLNDFKQTVWPFLIALGAMGLVVAGIQSDFGSASVMMGMMVLMAVIAGMPIKRLVGVGAVIVVLMFLAIATTGYRQDRLLTFLHPNQDCLHTGYQSCQAAIAVGSGGMTGLGLGNSVQAFGYLPEAENDSIFAIYAEKFGFVGVVAFLGLMVAFFARLKRVIERAPDDFSRLLVTGVFAWLSAQSLINIGAMLGVLPLKGITLPFISYGGTSVLFVMAAVGLVFHISRYTLYSIPEATETGKEGTSHEDRLDRRRVRGAYHPGTSSRSRA